MIHQRTRRHWTKRLELAAIVAASISSFLGCAATSVDASDPSTGGAFSSNTGGSTVTGGNQGLGGSSNVGGASGGSTSTCYSPTQNLDSAYQANAVGCPCNALTEEGVCLQGVALVCESGFWMAVEDGPCMPLPPTTYSPESCTLAGGTAIPSPGTPMTAENDCPSGVALGVIDFASSGWDEGGLCCAPPANANQACGARAGNTCLATEYCAYVEGEACGAADAEASCKPRPETCIELYAPVCGCDRKTYSNSCIAAAAGTGIFAAGQCAN